MARGRRFTVADNPGIVRTPELSGETASIRECAGAQGRVGAGVTIEVFVPPMRCASGMCGLSWDEELVRFNQALTWLEQRSGNAIAASRYVLNQDRRQFLQNRTVRGAMRVAGGWKVLPITMINGQIVKQGGYPSWEELAAALTGAHRAEVHK